MEQVRNSSVIVDVTDAIVFMSENICLILEISLYVILHTHAF